MAIEYKDVLRVEGVENTLLTTTLRNKQVGFATDDQHRMLRKNATGTPDYWVPEGYSVTYNDITIAQYLYHDDNLTTYLRFTTDAFELSAGGKSYIKTESDKLLLEEEVKVGEVILPYTGGLPGNQLTLTSTGVASWVDSPTKEPTGFINPESISVTYDSVERTITLTGTSITLYWHGGIVLNGITSWVSDPHDNTNGTWFLYYNGTSFVWSNSIFTFDVAQIAIVNFGTTHKYAMREIHGLMGWETHKELHYTIGTYKVSGGALTGYLVDGTVDNDNRPGVDECIIADEDLQSNILELADNGPYTIFNLTGAGSTSVFTLSNANIVPLSSSYPAYNQYTGGAWQQTQLSSNDYMNIWVISVPVTADATSQSYRHLFMQGQNSYTTFATAQVEDPRSLSFGTLSNTTPEFVIIAQITIRRTVGLTGNFLIKSVRYVYGSRVAPTAATSVGLQGETGLQGTTGLIGTTGVQGQTGILGVTGLQGPTGTQGSTGVQGLQGNTGLNGNQGQTGLQGNQGSTGIQGNTGTNGIQGVQGATGLVGPTGAQGNTGANGIQGVTGLIGATGSQGLQGTTGLTGQTGTQGIQGATGLQGIQGQTGLRGTTGVQGSTGVVGNTGAQGYTGLRGTTGLQGSTGTNGIQGTTGVQGTTGLTGQTGLRGTTGVQGTTGLIGQTGLRGTTGVQGTTGLIGQTGLRGTTGVQGTTGLIGQTGLRGATGVQGTTGVQGNQGVTGLVGEGVTGLSSGLIPYWTGICLQNSNISTTTNVITVTGTPSSSGDARYNLVLRDPTAYAANVGPGIDFEGKYNASSYAIFASIKGTKVNATSGNYAGQLSFITRSNGSVPATMLTLTDVYTIKTWQNYINSSGTNAKGLWFDGADLMTHRSTATYDGDSRYTLWLQDDTAYGTGTGAGIVFGSRASVSGYRKFAGIKGVKANSTDGDYSGQLHLQTTLNGGNPSTRIIIDENGNVTLFVIEHATTDTDMFLCSDNGQIKYRTGEEITSDIGAVSGTGTTNYLTKFTNGTSGIIGDSSIVDNGVIISMNDDVKMSYYSISFDGSNSKGLKFNFDYLDKSLFDDYVQTNSTNSLITHTSNVDSDARSTLFLFDDTAPATGVGPGITFLAKQETYTATPTIYANIKGVRSNSTDYNASGQLHFQTSKDNVGCTTRMKIDEDGNVTLNTIAHETTDVDKFLCSNNGVIKYRTGLELYGDISGTTGFQGATGVQGLQGVTGPTGGLQGVTGLRGVTGLQGVTGLRGVTGLQGVTGLRGVTGTQGFTGATSAGSLVRTGTGGNNYLVKFTDGDAANPVVGASNTFDDGSNTYNTSNYWVSGTLGNTSLTYNRALYCDNSGVIKSAGTSSTELEYLSGVTSSIQTQLDSKTYITDGSFTATLHGCSSYIVESASAYYRIIGGVIHLELPGLYGTSNTDYMWISGLPVALRPSTYSRYVPCAGGDVFIDGGTQAGPVYAEVDGAGTGYMYFYKASGAVWTSSGTKGINRLFTQVSWWIGH